VSLGRVRPYLGPHLRPDLAALATLGIVLLASAVASAQAPVPAEVSSSALEVAPPPPAAAPAPAPPAPAPADLVKLEVGTRATFRMQNPTPGSRDELNDVSSEGEVDVVLRGQVHPFLKWQAGFVGSYGLATGGSHADVLDLVAKIEIADAFNLWVGRMPMPSDRSSLSTVWALPTWTLPGIYSSYPLGPAAAPRSWPGPRYGVNDRGDGATLWGQFHGGTLKYYAGAFDLDRANASPLYTARMNLSLLGPEPGYRSSSGYYGAKNVLAIGVSGQHQAGSSVAAPGTTVVPAANFNELGADVLFEMNGGAAGVVDVEGGLSKVWGKNELASYQIMGLASYLVPIDIGVGRIQPLVRLQHAGSGDAADASTFTGLDAQLGYIVDGYHARLLAVYQYAKLQGHTENAILFGLQLLSHGR
jgi:hypothetical protein